MVNGNMSGRFAILVEGIGPPALVPEIEQTIRDSFQEMTPPGSWRVRVPRSRASGRWDFSVHRFGVRRTISLAVPRHLLQSVARTQPARPKGRP
jgi:hypothetical protein